MAGYWVLAATLVAAPLAAQTDGGTAAATFSIDYYKTFAPINALQVVERTPGFTLDNGDSELRGFSGAAGNVVINGQRPSSKTDNLATVLARIPASRVQRVELSAGDRFGADYAGRNQVLNLILTEAGGLAGTVEAGVSRSFLGGLYPQGNASALLKGGTSSFNVAARLENDNTPEEGSDTLTDAVTGRLVEFRRKINRVRNPNGSLSASWALDEGVNRTANVNGRFALSRFRLSQENDVFPTGGVVRDDRLQQVYDQREFELGGDVTRPLWGGGLKLVGLITRRHRENFDVSFNRVRSEVIGGFSQLLDDERAESVVRASWNRSNLGGWTVEAGGEGVLNTLRSDVDLSLITPGGGTSPIDLPVDNALVKEYRGEAFVNAGRAIAPRTRLDMGLTYEASRLTVSGDAEAERSLRFLKPKATLDWRSKTGVHAQLSVTRTVAQLQFEDFISSAELTNERVNGGNAFLLPQRAWEVRGLVEKAILGDGLARLELGYDAIALLQDRVPTPEGFDAPGNLGNAERWTVRGTIEAPLTKLGIKGGRLTAYGSIVETSVVDPYTLERRRFSGNNLAVWNVQFRQDRTKFAWGFGLFGNSGGTIFRRDELDFFSSDQPYVTAFAEYRPSARTTVALNVENLTDEQARRRRTFFKPDRRTRSARLVEERERNRHVVPTLTVKHSFG